jgi:penicillin amidase
MRLPSLLASLGLATLALVSATSACIIETSDKPLDNRPPPVEPTGTSLPGLQGAVEVIVDDRAMPHIYAESLHDAALVQGYLMARDRYPQMEIIRRNVTGRLAEFIGPLSPAALESDVAARVIGFKRTADKIYASLKADDPVKIAMDAFAVGVNLHVKDLRDKTEKLPAGADLLELLLQQPEAFTDWTPEDSIAIGRYLSHALSYSASDDVAMTAAMAKVAEVFPAGDPREGLFRDFWSFAPARDVFTRDGFPNVGMDSGTKAVIKPPHKGKVISPARPEASVMASATRFLSMVDRLSAKLGDESRGSNNWIVSGSKTASGAPLMANDPHLSLPSPPLFWYAHLSTKRAGGDLDVQGIALAGVPGIILGYNEHIAWGSTTAGYDVTDVYEETITEGANGAPDTVLFKGQQVPIEIIKETIKVSGGNDVVIELERVPHHGIIMPTIEKGAVVPRTSQTALSVRWTGDDVSHETAAFLKLDMARSLEEAQAALDSFEVGAQSFVIATREGDIFWSTQSRVPVRDPKAMTYDPATQMGLAPAMVLPGDGSAEWIGDLDEKYIPHDLNPTRGFIATANNDLVGTSKDGNPFNDPHFVTWDSDIGHRVARITERLTELTDKGQVTPEDMVSVQGDHKSALGALLTPAFIAAAKRVAKERATPGTHADLTELVSGASAEDLDALAAATSRLEKWTSFEASAGVDIGDGEPPPEEVADSIAAAIFNVATKHVVQLAFGDEADALGTRPWTSNTAKVLQWAILEPQRLATYSDALKDTVLWDDLKTDGVMESRDERIARAMLEAIDSLTTKLGADMEGWRWGKLHTVVFEALVPSLQGESAANIPAPGDMKFPGGFPRPGDNFGIDAASFGVWNVDSYSFDSGPVQRLVVEMTPTGPKAWNALPGGQHYDPSSKHHADEAEHWRRNAAPPLYFTDADVNAHVETKLNFRP